MVLTKWIIDDHCPIYFAHEFTGFSGEAASWLLRERDVTGLGTECIDVELGWKTKNEVKQTLATQSKVSLVQLANLDILPAKGFSLTIAPLKLKDGSGGPTRVFAVSNQRHHRNKNHHNNQRPGYGFNYQPSKREEDPFSTKVPRSPEDDRPSNFQEDPSPAPPFRATFPSEPLRSSGISSFKSSRLLVVLFSLCIMRIFARSQ